MRSLTCLFSLAGLLAFSCLGLSALPDKSTYPPKLEGAREETYREVKGRKLNVWIYEPSTAKTAGSKRPAIVFFFGGGWRTGSPAQFERQAKYFAERGMVAITADYRVSTRDQATISQCVEDAKSCIRWVRQNADRLGVDPQKIVSSGGSAGGHLAAAVAVLPGFEDPAADLKVSSGPNAMILFNPALMLAPYEGIQFSEKTEDHDNSVTSRFGCPPEAISPIHHVRAGLPPTLILHGRDDTTVPYKTVDAFATAMQQAGNQCLLVGYEGQKHGFFNTGSYDATLAEADRFLVSLGYLSAKP